MEEKPIEGTTTPPASCCWAPNRLHKFTDPRGYSGNWGPLLQRTRPPPAATQIDPSTRDDRHHGVTRLTLTGDGAGGGRWATQLDHTDGAGADRAAAGCRR